jgi:anti-sigma B factor antagonist/stage II sporulation protein AA (anti-sigma F factor antagonist)
MAALEIKEQIKSPWTILSLNGKLDALTAASVEEALFKCFQDGNTHVILNFHGLAYLSSAGLRILLSHTKKFKSANRKLILVEIPSAIMEVIQLAGFEKVFSIAPLQQAAMQQ